VGTRAFAVLFACLIFSLGLSASQADAQTRRAFLVGNQNYKDGNIQQLRRTINDARDLARDLEEIGFDKKNIKVVTDVKDKNAFDKKFNAFLQTVNTGDTVFFYVSGHGVGVEADQNNYLLFTDVKSPFAYVRAQLPEKDRRDAALINYRVRQYLDAYNRDEIPLSCVSTKEIEQKLYERRPKTVIMIIDACRTLAAATRMRTRTHAPAAAFSPSRHRLGTSSSSIRRRSASRQSRVFLPSIRAAIRSSPRFCVTS